MLNETAPLSLARVKELCDVTRHGETVVAMATEILELRKDRDRLDWLSQHVVQVYDSKGIVFGIAPEASETLREYIDLTTMVIP